jgi:hypothetical protein
VTGTPRVAAVADDLTTLDGERVERILVVTAHPDDVDFGAAGAVAVWTASGVDVTYCVVTNGAAGSQDDSIARDELAGVREREQRAAALAVGVTDVRFLGYPDGRLMRDLDLRRDLSRVMRDVRPQRVVAQSPPSWSSTACTCRTPITGRPGRRRSTPCTPTRAMSTRTLSCSPKGWRRGRSRRST